MQDDLLWVYEGLTQYYGMILTARSGLWPPEFARDELAVTAAAFDRKRPGRSWRSLEDTTFQPVITPRRPLSWMSWQRTEDYYMESVLLWLDVDTKLRELSGGAPLAGRFRAGVLRGAGDPGWVSTYELEDVVRSLNAVAAIRLGRIPAHARDRHSTSRCSDGLERAGYRLVYNDKPNAGDPRHREVGAHRPT